MLFIDPADNRLTSLGKQQAGRGGWGGVDERQRREGAAEFTCGKKQNRAEEERGMFEARGETEQKKTEDNEEEAASHPSTHLHLTISHLIVDDSDGGRRDCHREG